MNLMQAVYACVAQIQFLKCFDVVLFSTFKGHIRTTFKVLYILQKYNMWQSDKYEKCMFLSEFVH